MNLDSKQILELTDEQARAMTMQDIRDIQWKYFMRVVESNDMNFQRAADQLGLSIETVRRAYSKRKLFTTMENGGLSDDLLSAIRKQFPVLQKKRGRKPWKNVPKIEEKKDE